MGIVLCGAKALRITIKHFVLQENNDDEVTTHIRASFQHTHTRARARVCQHTELNFSSTYLLTEDKGAAGIARAFSVSLFIVVTGGGAADVDC